MNKKLEQQLNKQVNAEMGAAYLYLSMSAYFAENNLHGFSHWMKIQFREEQAHATKLYSYIIERGGKVVLEEIEAPKKVWNGIIDAFEDVLKHEEKVTALINDLTDLAIKEKDNASAALLQWFVSEQVQEEDMVSNVLDSLKLYSKDTSGLLLLDKEASTREYEPI